MRGSRWLAAAIVVGSVSTGVAVAGSGSSETKRVDGTFEARLANSPVPRRCDANHEKFRLRFEGRQRSSDDRLTGRLEVNVETVRNTDNGWGYTSGSVVIRRRGEVRFRGELEGVVEPDRGAEGFVTGQTRGPQSMRLLANFNLDQNPDTFAITGEFGKDSQVDKPYASHEDQDPAVLTDACDDGHGHGHR